MSNLLSPQSDGSRRSLTGGVTIGAFLLRRLKEIGVDHIFGVPGDFVLAFFNKILSSEVQYIGTCNELNAAYAADAYARIRGVGAFTTTYAVGELSAINGLAGSWAENVPVVTITGCPPTSHWSKGTLLHHTLGNYLIPKQMFEKITISSCIIDNPHTAVSEIDKVLSACVLYKKPVYIGICSDMVQIEVPNAFGDFVFPSLPISEKYALEESVLEVLKCIHESRRPILIPGLEVRRFGLQNAFNELLAKSNLPYSTMMLGKTILDEEHPQHIGLYCGDRSRQYVKDYVENSDCLIVFGEKMTDFNTGGFTAILDSRSTIVVNRDSVRVSYHTYHDVYIHDFISQLTNMIIKREKNEVSIKPAITCCVHNRTTKFTSSPHKPLTMNRLFDRMTHFIPENSVVIAETGASLFSAAEVLMPKGVHFIGQTFYGSIGYTVGATLGACIAAPEASVITFVGDGSFQVTCQELSTMIRYGCTPTIALINNDGYTIERVIVDHSYNDIQMWNYHRLVDVFGGCAEKTQAYYIKTEDELEKALALSKGSKKLNFLELILERFDCNDALRRAGEAMARQNNLFSDQGTIKRKLSKDASEYKDTLLKHFASEKHNVNEQNHKVSAGNTSTAPIRLSSPNPAVNRGC